MSTELDRHAKEIFVAARRQPREKLSAFLDEACGDDAGVRTEVESLLGYLDETDLSPPPLEIESLFEGKYEVLHKISEGGMGVVYRVRHLLLGEHRVVKVIRPQLAADPGLRQRFLREARIAARLRHPKIAQFYDFSMGVDGTAWIVMEFVDGRTFADFLQVDGPPPLELVIEMAIQTLDALAYLHRKSFVHRDISPDNVMLTRDFHGGPLVKLIDLGIAKHLDGELGGDLTAAGMFVGKRRYSSPEQFGPKAIDQRSDLYSFGVMLYELLTGSCPIEGETPEEMIAGHLFRPPVTFDESDTGGRVPLDLRRTVMRALAKEPDERITTAEEFIDLLMPFRHPGSEMIVPDPAPYPTKAGAERSELRLRQHPLPELPERPYPVLLPYTHPGLFGGRERDLSELRRGLRQPIAILGLYAPSGTGKSSLLLGGLLPMLRQEGRAAALVRHPQEPGLAQRLLADLVTSEASAMDEGDWRIFAERLEEVADLAGEAPVLIVDQFEDLFRSDDTEPARAFFGPLLAATVQGRSTPVCRWILGYREEFHGEVVAWLEDVLAEARARRLPGIDSLPHHLTTPDRFHAQSLTPLGSSLPGADPKKTAAAAFLAAIETPLELRSEDGARHYPWRFEAGGAERLAKSFADARVARPEAPLLPELQVVLAHLLARAGEDGVITVPEDLGDLIDQALEDHLARALEAAFPVDESAGARTGRARALLALRELATATGQRGESLSAKDLARAIGEDGEAILDQLATPLTRLVVAREAPDGLRYALSHDRLAEVVVRMVEKEGRHGRLVIDADLLRLRRFVALEAALYRSGEAAPRLSRRRFERLSAHAEALLWDEDRRAWWEACRQRRYAESKRTMTWSLVGVALLALVVFGVWSWTSAKAKRQTLLDDIAQGPPEVAFEALDRLRLAGGSAELLRTQLAAREEPSEVLELGLGGLTGARRSAAVLATVELLLPSVDEDPVRIANLVWALDYAPARDPAFSERAGQVRDQVLAPLRRLRPPPPPPGPGDPEWIEIPAGSFLMGRAEGVDGEAGERPQHRVTVSAFRLLRHEVTSYEYCRLVPEQGCEGDLPASKVDWYAAYTYAAWLGGRLPTEAEWEYAARAGCAFQHCDAEGRETTVDAVAWTLSNARDVQTGEALPKPVMTRTPNPWGLFDMFGSHWEWTADWNSAYSGDPQDDPWGPTAPTFGGRMIRGGSYGDRAVRARPASRGSDAAASATESQGFRVLLPAEPP